MQDSDEKEMNFCDSGNYFNPKMKIKTIIKKKIAKEKKVIPDPIEDRKFQE